MSMDVEKLFADDTAQELMRAIEPITQEMHYLLIVIHPSGGALQLSNVPPEGQRHYLERSMRNMDRTEPTQVKKPSNH